MTQRTILITGSSSGIGYCCATKLKDRGWRVFATARSQADLERLGADGLEAVELDYTKPETIAACADTVLQATGGRLDALFNNGAHGQPGALEDLSTDALRQQFEANFFGHHDLTRRVIPAMRQAGQGRIVFCSSILGLITLKYRGAYNASKFAIEAYADTMRLELKGTGIHVCAIQPGPIATRFAETALKYFHLNVDAEASPHRENYKAQEVRLKNERKSFLRLGPEAVYEKLRHAVESDRPRPQYFVTGATHVAAWGKRILSKKMADRLLEKVS